MTVTSHYLTHAESTTVTNEIIYHWIPFLTLTPTKCKVRGQFTYLENSYSFTKSRETETTRKQANEMIKQFN